MQYNKDIFRNLFVSDDPKIIPINNPTWKCFKALFVARDNHRLDECAKIVEIRNFSGPYSVQIRENTDQKRLHIWAFFMQWWIFQNLFFSVKNRNNFLS